MIRYTENEKWKRSTALALWGTAIQFIFSFIGISLLIYLLYNLSNILLSGILPSIAAMNIDYYQNTFIGITLAGLICILCSLLGYILYIIGICLFKGAQNSINSEVRTRNIMLTELIMLGLLILLITLIFKYPEYFFQDMERILGLAFISWAGSMTAIIFLFRQFKSLTKEDSWSEMARQGADDLKFSYSCIVWIQIIIILGCGIIALTIFSQLKSLSTSSYNSYGINEVVGGALSMAERINNFISIIKLEIIFMGLPILIFMVTIIIFRIKGWNKIRSGSNDKIFVFSSNSQRVIRNVDSACFCHKCGRQLPNDSLFCPACGTKIDGNVATDLIAEQEVTIPVSQVQYGPDASTIVQHTVTPLGVYEEEEPNRWKKWMIWGSVAAIIAIVGVWAIWSRGDNMKPDMSVLTDNSMVYKNIEDGIGIEPIEELKYGTSVESQKSEYDQEGRWIKIAFEKNGKIETGYTFKNNLVSTEDLILLEKGGMSDSDIRNVLSTNIERLALLHALKNNQGNWELEVINTSGERRPNSKRLIVRRAAPSEECIGFILKNIDTDGGRRFFLYSTPDIYTPDNSKEPVFLHTENVLGNSHMIYDASLRKNSGVYDVSYTQYPDQISYNEDDYDSNLCEEDGETKSQFGGLLEMSGNIDGKYEIKMKITEYPDGTITGSYYYVKNNTPIQLTGSYTDKGDHHEISVVESVDNRVTGNFIGNYDGRVFSGSWISSDGSKEMPFRLER